MNFTVKFNSSAIYSETVDHASIPEFITHLTTYTGADPRVKQLFTYEYEVPVTISPGSVLSYPDYNLFEIEAQMPLDYLPAGYNTENKYIFQSMFASEFWDHQYTISVRLKGTGTRP